MNRTAYFTTICVFMLLIAAVSPAKAGVTESEGFVPAECPSISITGVSASPSVLWPPNHLLVPVTVNYTASLVAPAPSFCNPVCALSVTSNEPENGTGDGDTAPDWQLVDAHHVLLRAERSGQGKGRIYTIKINCNNGTHVAQASATVTVPHNQ